MPSHFFQSVLEVYLAESEARFLIWCGDFLALKVQPGIVEVISFYLI